MTRRLFLIAGLMALAGLAPAEDYTGPRPPQKDVVYLIHADNLVATDTVDAQQESKKDDIVYSVSGTAASAKTPLAEPIFLLASDKLEPQSLELYRFEVKGGRRELTVPQKRRKGGPRAYRLSVTRVEKGLYRIEASETLENGEYSLSPQGSNKVFCFSVY